VCIASRINVYAFFTAFILVVLGIDYFGYQKQGVLAAIFSPLMFEFVLGVFLYPLWARTKKYHGQAWFLSILVLLSAFLLLCDFDPYFSFAEGHYRRSAIDGTAAFFLVFFFLALEGKFKPSREFVFLGDASYSLYLGHWLWLTFTPFLFWKAGWFPDGSLAVYVFAAALSALAFGVLVHLAVERPINRWLKPFLARLDEMAKPQKSADALCPAARK